MESISLDLIGLKIPRDYNNIRGQIHYGKITNMGNWGTCKKVYL